MKFSKPADRERLVRAVLVMKPEVLAQDAAANLGIHRTTFSRIRSGEMWRDVLPELPRFLLERTTRSCHDCVHWAEPKRRGANPCGLGFPEPKRRGHEWGRLCSVFSEGA